MFGIPKNPLDNAALKADAHYRLPLMNILHRHLLPAFLLLACFSLSAAQTFNIRAYGAKGDGITFDTEAIQKALDACSGTGGTVEVPAGTYLTKPLLIGSKSTLLLDEGSTLLGSTNYSDWMKVPGDWLEVKASSEFIPLIGGKDLSEVTLTGTGVIDGNGSLWWGEAEKARQKKSGFTLPRPNLIGILRCKNLKIENITLQNSPKFHLVPTECEGVLISHVTIRAPERAANTDAIDPSNCKDVVITRCLIDVGDDNVAIKSGKKVAGRDFGCENIIVSDCAFLHGHGMSIGSETAGGVRNVSVRNCTFENTENGIRIKSAPGKGGIVENISFDNISMKNVNPAITFTCFYENNSAGDASLPGTPAADSEKIQGKIPSYRDIRISNLTATCPKGAGKILGLPESEITNVVMDHVKISAQTGFQILNASGIRLQNVDVTAANGEPFLLKNAKVTGLPSAP